MAEVTTGTSINSRGRKRAAKLSSAELDQVKAAACEALDEVWGQFTGALDETEGEYAASIGVQVRYKPGKETESKTTPATVEVFGKASLPTHKKVFEARVSGGQLSLSLGFDA